MHVDTQTTYRVSLTPSEWSLIGRALVGKIRRGELTEAANLNVQLTEQLLQIQQQNLNVAASAATKAREALTQIQGDAANGNTEAS
jgi:hypothetical protein